MTNLFHFLLRSLYVQTIELVYEVSTHVKLHKSLKMAHTMITFNSTTTIALKLKFYKFVEFMSPQCNNLIP